MIQVLPKETTISALLDHFSFQNLLSQVNPHISLCPYQIKFHIIHGSHLLASRPTSLIPAGQNRRNIEKHSKQRTIYWADRLILPSPFSRIKHQNHKKKTV